MSFKERESAILEYLQEKKEATVGELCRAFFVSEPTMRRDLLALHGAGKILRTHGGAVYRGEPGENLPQGFREREHMSAKALIAKRCLSLIKDEDMKRLFAKAAKLGLGIELNVGAWELSESALPETIRPYRIAAECGCKFYLGSDAHAPDELNLANPARMAELLCLDETQKFKI